MKTNTRPVKSAGIDGKLSHGLSIVPAVVAVIASSLLTTSLIAPKAAASVYPAPTKWTEVYDPTALLSLNVQLTAEDYATIQADETFDIEVPAVFWVDNIDPNPGAWNIFIRRKSATPIGEKISYRIKLDSKIGPGKARWVNIKSLSLENGDDNNVVSEGLAWFLHRQAWNDNYQPGLAAWVTLTMHVVGPVLSDEGLPVCDPNTGEPLTQIDVRPQGVYVNVELPDKRFLENRGKWTSTSVSWLYKQDDIGPAELKEWPYDSTSPESDSPAHLALNYSPFQKEIVVRKKVQNPPPNDTELKSQLDRWINMDSMLRLGAVNAFAVNPDELFNHAKNYFWADFDNPGQTTDNRRLYYPWDLDAAIRDPKASIYGTITGGGRKTTVSQHPYQQIILNHPAFRTQYNDIMSELLAGPLAVDVIHGFLNGAQALLTEALLADPNNQIGNTPQAIAAHFDSLRAWTVARHKSVLQQLIDNGPPSPRD